MNKASENKANQTGVEHQSKNAGPETENNTDNNNNNEDTVGTRTLKLEQDLWPDDEVDQEDTGGSDTRE